MPADAVTCASCRTLNPPAAPACVRCNSPLTQAPIAGPLPAAAPAEPFVPADTPKPRNRATTQARDERIRSLTAADQRGIVRRVEIAGLVIVLLVLVVGGYLVWHRAARPIDGAAVATEIGRQLGGQLGQQVSVRCPATAERAAGTTFTCTATDGGGRTRTVEVTVTGDDGAYRWTLR